MTRINNHDSKLFTKLKIENPISWEAIAESIFQWTLPSAERGNNTATLFARLWRRLASEFTEKDCVNEYNSLKHGFRVRPGGFKLTIGLEKGYGGPPSEKETHVLGESSYGTSFYSIEAVPDRKGDRNLVARHVSLNWTIEKATLLIRLIAMSIGNIKSALEIVNGANLRLGKFVRPVDDDDFEKPWSYSPGVTRFSEDPNIQVESIPFVTKADLLQELGEWLK